jgi:hypothetical protein
VRHAAAVREAGRGGREFHAPDATREQEGVLIERAPSVGLLSAGHNPQAVGSQTRSGGSPVGAYLVDVEMVGVGDQVNRDLVKKMSHLQ